MGEFAIGQSVSRFEDPRLLKGGGRYVADMVLPGMVFGHVLRSPHAHAKIRSVDTAAAYDMPGVEAIYTGADLVADDRLDGAAGARKRHVHDVEPGHLLEDLASQVIGAADTG